MSAFAARPYVEQAGLLFNGFAQASEWDERGSQVGYFDLAHLIQARNALVIALTALPAQGAGFFAVDDLDRALFERIGEHFSLSYLRRSTVRLRQDTGAGPPGINRLAGGRYARIGWGVNAHGSTAR